MQPPGPRDRVVLAALALDHGSVVPADRLADALWQGDPPRSWNKVVQGCVVRLRKRLGAESIATGPNGYRLVISDVEYDVTRFERLVGRARELLTLGEPDRALATVREALELWRGDPFRDLDGWEAAEIELARLEQIRLDAEEIVLESAIRAGRHREVLAEAQARCAQQPVREHRWALLARAEYQSGRQAEALRTLQRARTHLTREVGIDPGPGLVELEEAILRQDPALDVRAVGHDVAVTCPYQGLIPYGIDDSEMFHGRESIVAGCLQVLADEGVVAVVGPSGCGKSSVVRAGIAAALKASGQGVTVITPGARPNDAISAFPSGPGQILVVDQCEEAISAGDLLAMSAFLEAIVHHAQSGAVVVALRADRIGDVSRHAGFARLLERGLQLLGPMDEGDLRAAIERPAEQAGLLIEPGLVDVLVGEVEGEPGALPLLSHALRQTWERREGRVLTVAGYRATGGLRGAVARTAEALFETIDEDQRVVVRDLMLRMVTPSADGDPVRSAIPRRAIDGDRPHQQVIELLVDARLVTIDGANVELAHEALIRAWPRLRTWLDDDVDGQRILRHLTLAADSWDTMDQPDSELYRGARLRAALEWRERADPDLTPTESAYLDAGNRLAERESIDAGRRAVHQARVNRQLRLLLTGAASLLVISLIAGFVALRAANRADREASSAREAQARALAVASLKGVPDDRSQALLLAVEAQRLDDSTITRQALLGALAGQPLTRTLIPTGAPDYVGLALATDGDLAVGKRSDGAVDVIDLINRSVIRAGLIGPTSVIGGIDIDPSGSFVAASGVGPDGATTVVHDVESGRTVATFAGSYGLAQFAPTGDELAIADEAERTIRIVEAGDWDVDRTFDIDSDQPVSAIEYTADGSGLYVGMYVPTFEPTAELRLIDSRTGATIAGPVDTGEPGMSSIVEMPDGTIALVGDSIRRFDAQTLAPVGEPFGRSDLGGLVTLAVAPDGSLAVGSPVDLRIYRDVPGSRDETVVDSGAPGLAFVVQGSMLVTADITGTISEWTLGAIDDLGSPLQPPGAGNVESSPGGAVLAVWGAGRGVELFDRESLGHLGPLDVGPELSLLGVTFDPDGGRIATLTCPRDRDPCPSELTVWDVASRRRVAGPVDAGHQWAGMDQGVAFVDDGTLIATAGVDGAVHVWDAGTLAPAGDPLVLADVAPLPGEQVRNVAASDVDGRSLLAAMGDFGVTVVWELTDTGASPIGSVANAVVIAFAPDGRLLTGAARGSFVLRDPFTLEIDSAVFPASTAPTSFQFSESGVIVASGGFGTELWNLDTGQAMSTALPAPHSAISPDGSTLYLGAAGFDPIGFEVRVMSLLPADLSTEACRRAGRNLTASEWSTLMGPSSEYRPTCVEWAVPDGSEASST